MASGSFVNFNHYIFRYQVGTSGAGNDPLAFAVAPNTKTTQTLSVYAKDDNNMYEMMKDSEDKLSINHYTFDETASSYSYKTTVLSYGGGGTSPF